MEESRMMRTEMLIGGESVQKLKNKKVVILGVGGVGSFTTEAIARGGVGNIIICDNDTVNITNINRQIVALTSTIGRKKVDIMRERILDINPEANVIAYDLYVNEENMETIIPKDTDYVIDAIDTVTSKLQVIEYCKKHNIKQIACMGTGNKIDPTRFKVSDISKTSVCPLAKVIRQELKKRKIKKVKVVFSDEIPTKSQYKNEETGKAIPMSVSFVPSVAGLTIAGEVLRDLW